jgi:hypothetical protein
MNLVKQISLENGLSVCFYDHTQRYFGDYYRVKLEIVCEVPLLPNYFTDRQAHTEAIALLGLAATYRRRAERMGVFGKDLEGSLTGLVDGFAANALPYLASPDFPRQLVAGEIAKTRLKARRQFAENE